MTKAKLQTTLVGILTALPISLDLLTKGRLLKTGNPYPNAMKMFTMSGIMGMDYANGVNNQLGRENQEMDFFAKEHPWMDRAERNLGLNRYKNDAERYLPMKVQSATKAVYVNDGVDVTDAIQAFIPKKSESKTQEKLEKKVHWRAPSLDSIVAVRMLGAEHTING
tara:strand:+ start:245 stop:742 length:498 start_codon:yes stop_codon:yes gene_type:complete